MLLMPHELDPNLLDMGEDYEHRIYGDDCENAYAIVDAVDYWHFSQWRWKAKSNKSGKLYMVRSTNMGSRVAGFPSVMLYLHVEIMKRTGVPKPDQYHKNHRPPQRRQLVLLPP